MKFSNLKLSTQLIVAFLLIGIVPFLVAVIAGIIILMIFPQIVLFLPNLVY